MHHPHRQGPRPNVPGWQGQGPAGQASELSGSQLSSNLPGPGFGFPQAPARPGPVPSGDADGIPGPATLGTGKVKQSSLQSGGEKPAGLPGGGGGQGGTEEDNFPETPLGASQH